jgi:hypothetical protein
MFMLSCFAFLHKLSLPLYKANKRCLNGHGKQVK